MTLSISQSNSPGLSKTKKKTLSITQSLNISNCMSYLIGNNLTHSPAFFALVNSDSASDLLRKDL